MKMSRVKTPDEIIEDLVPDFYDPANMALAWTVLNWINTWDQNKYWTQYTSFWGWWSDAELWQIDGNSAQRKWLDRVLELAIEAKLVKLDGQKAV